MLRYFGISFIFSAISLYLLKHGIYFLPSQGWFWCPTEEFKHYYRDTIGDTVPVRYLLMFTMIPFLITSIFVEGKRKIKEKQHSLWRALDFYSRFLASYWLNILLMVITKFIFPEPRPHFMQTCDPEPSLLSCNGSNNNYQKYEDGICRMGRSSNQAYFTQKDILDSLRSFPSGHAQTGVFTAVIALHYVFSNRDLSITQKVPFALFWICNALFMSISRITDNRHHWWDVLGGFLFGAIYSFISINFFLYRNQMKSVKTK